MSHYDEQPGTLSTRGLAPQTAGVPDRPHATPDGNADAEAAELRRALLIRGTVGNPVRVDAATQVS